MVGRRGPGLLRRTAAAVAVLAAVAATAPGTAGAGVTSALSLLAAGTPYADAVVADAPRGYWRLDELSGTVAADRAGTAPGTYVNGVTLGSAGALSSELNASATFDGSNDHVAIPSTPALGFTTAVTVEAWIKRQRSGAYQVVVGKPGHGQSKNENYAIWINTSNRVQAYFGNGTNFVSVTSSNPIDTAWHHVAATYDSVTARLYLDGALSDSRASTAGMAINAQPLNIGRSNDNSYFFGGQIDEVAVYPTSLSAARILSHYTTGTSDRIAPTLTLASPVAGALLTDTTPTLSGVAGTAGGDGTTVTLRVYAGSTATGSPLQTLPTTRGAGGAYATDATPLADGIYTATASQSDTAGNIGTAGPTTFTIDTTAPAITLAGPVNGSTSTNTLPVLTGSAGVAPGDSTTVLVRLYAGATATGTPLQTLTAARDASGAYAAQVTAPLADGTYTASAEQTDTAGNLGHSTTSTFSIDTTAPVVTFGAVPGDPSNNASPSITFSSDPGSAFQCSLDGAGFAPCSTPLALTNLADGSHGLQVAATDPAGNTSGVIIYSWTIDTVAPIVSITEAPPSSSTSTSATFSFALDSPGVFRCRLDGGANQSCSSPYVISSLGEGAHTFDVVGLDEAGNASAPASHAWTVETAGPAVTIDSGPSGTTTQTTATFTFSSPAGGASFECGLDGSAFAPCSSPQTFAELAAGSHSFTVRAITNGNPGPPATRSWSVSIVGPTETTITSSPPSLTNVTTATFAFTATEGTPQFECALDGSAFALCVSPRTYVDLADGAHNFAVRAVDSLGNPSAAASFAWTIDTVAPAAPTIDSGPANPSTSSSAAFAFSSTEPGATYRCSIDGATPTACTSPYVASGLADGSHTFELRVKDVAGNQAIAAAVWSIDTIAPTTTITSRPANPTNETTASFSFSASESGATFACSLDAAAFTSCASPDAQADLSGTSHTFRIRATDAAGNVGASAVYTWTVDVVPPATPTISGGPTGTTASTSAVFAFSGDESPATFRCRLDAGVLIPCVSPHTYNGLASATHTFEVSAVDASGNVSPPAARTWTVDAIPPVVTLTSPAASSLLNTATPTFLGTGETAPGDETTVTVSVYAGSTAGGTAVQTLTATVAGGAYSITASPALPAGTYTARAVQQDFAGNTGSSSANTFSIDLTAPVVTLAAPLNGGSTASARPSFSGAASTGAGDATTVSVRIYAGGTASGSPLQTISAAVTAGTWAATAASDLGTGTYTARAEQSDAAGNTGFSAASTFTITDPFLIGAGDIAGCGTSTRDDATSDILVANPDGIVFTLGDNAYDNGTAAEYANCYDPTWGRVKSRTRPMIGDHEYATNLGQPHFDYFRNQLLPFGETALDPLRGWYSYDVGQWHIVYLNASCTEGVVPGCNNAAQETWLVNDLQAHPSQCTGVVLHAPRWSSGNVHGDNPQMQGFWNIFHREGVELVMSGDEHIYERFAPMTSGGVADPAYGVRQFIVGTGGYLLYGIGTVKPNSEVRNADAFGVLKLTLHPGSYSWQFIPEAGKTFTDAGTTACHAKPPVAPGPAVRASSSGVSSSGSLTLALPAGTQQNDVLVATVAHQGGVNRTASAPAGWTLVPNTDWADGTNARIRAWYRIAGPSEPASYTFTLAGGALDMAGGIAAIRSASTTSPINASGGQVNASSTSFTAPSLTTTAANTLLLYAAGPSTGLTFTPPPAMLEAWDVMSAGTYKVSSELAGQVIGPTGPTGTRAALGSTSSRSVAIAIAIASS